MKQNKHVLVVKQDSNRGYAWFDVIEMWERGTDTPYWDSVDYKTHPEYRKINGIRLYAQCGGGESDRKYMYAMDVRYNGSDYMFRDMDQIEQDIKRIKTIKKKFDTIVSKYGYPDTFAKFVFYIADCIGAEVVKPYYESSRDMVTLTLGDLEYMENRLIESVS